MHGDASTYLTAVTHSWFPGCRRTGWPAVLALVMVMTLAVAISGSD